MATTLIVSCGVIAALSAPDPLIELQNNCSPHLWLNSTGWISNGTSTVVPVCGWYGVGCSPGGTITSLNLYGNGLNGPACAIPQSIDDLHNLTHLSVGSNFFSAGGVPEEIGNLTKLAYLNLEMANVTGTLPSSIASLPRLEHLIARSNGLSGALPSTFGIRCMAQ